MWLPIFFSPSEASQAAGRRFLRRVRARTEDRDIPVSEATIAAHSAAAREWGAAAPGSFDYVKQIRHLRDLLGAADLCKEGGQRVLARHCVALLAHQLEPGAVVDRFAG